MIPKSGQRFSEKIMRDIFKLARAVIHRTRLPGQGMSPNRAPFMTAEDCLRLIDEVTSIVSRAAAAILGIERSDLDVRAKDDRSPFTAADEASQAVLGEGLARLLPDLPMISEEAVASWPERLGETFLLVDPLDGTREFVAGRDEYAINVALVSGRVPLLGIIAAPARGEVWRGVVGHGAEILRLAPGMIAAQASARRPIRTRARPRDMIAMVSRSHLDPRSEAFLARLGTAERVACGSALKFCRVAEGAADVYPRLAQTSEWDVAAGHALVAAAGGTVVNPQGTALTYGGAAQRFLVPGFVCWGDPVEAEPALP
jgi:3'(2'), 5'-bisphosphate nucleotidase